MAEHDLFLSLLAIALILVTGRGMAEVAHRLGQPEVLGEMLAGLLLGVIARSIIPNYFPAVHKLISVGPGVTGPLALLSWTGAILLLLIAGLEADLDILWEKARPGGWVALGAIVPSLVVGSLFAWFVLGEPAPGCFFLGLVLSVTAVSVAAKLLIEDDVLRRGYAQVILAAGIASEVIVWPLISVLSAMQASGSPVRAGLQSALLATLFFVVMLTAGKRFTFWAMRRVADVTHLINGQLSLVLVLAFLSAATTDAIGLHPLLGAFTFGIVLGRAPRATLPLKENVQALTVGLFAPVFFVLAGMRIDILKLEGVSAIGSVLLLLSVSVAAKSVPAALGARLGGLSRWEALLAGVGVNLKGGTDVIIAILGVEQGLVSERIYTLYAVAAVLTVLLSPPLLRRLERRALPTESEVDRLNREEARRRAYLTGVERILLPMLPRLLPEASADMVHAIARVKHAQGEIFDITVLHDLPGEQTAPAEPPTRLTQIHENLASAGALERVELTHQASASTDPGQGIVAAAQGHTILAFGAQPSPELPLALGELQDHLLNSVAADVLVTIEHGRRPKRVKRILAPVNGLEYSLAAADVAAYLAKAHDAELVLFTVMHAKMDPLFWKEGEHRRLEETGYRILREVHFRVERLGVRCRGRVRLGEDAGDEILKELSGRRYQLLVVGAVDRGSHVRLHLGRVVDTVVTRSRIQTVLLVSHGQVV